MEQKTSLKEKLSSVGGYIAAGVMAVIGILIYLLKNKGKEINALKAQIDLADTQKKADLIDVQINQKLEQKDLLKKEQQELEKTAAQLAEKRKQLASEEANKTEEEAEDYWNKK